MIFIGFGFLMVFLKSHTWTSIGFNYLIACWSIQIAILWIHFWTQVCKYYDNQAYNFMKLDLTIKVILEADFCAAAILISFGAILGKVSMFQLFVYASFEVFFYALNIAIITNIFKSLDDGGTIVIHVFGGYFGVASLFFFNPRAACQEKTKEKPLDSGNYLTDLVSMTGTLFLFSYWPSFNAAVLTGSNQERAVINTYLSIGTSIISAIIISRITHGGKLDMEIILNASLAGGVIMGANAVAISKPYGAMLAGFIAGTISSLGYAVLQPFLRRTINMHDTCGVHNLHAIPGFMGGILSCILAYLGANNFGSNYGSLWSDVGGINT